MRKYYQVHAFTANVLKGNAAGVVLNADGLTEKEMQIIAQDLNLTETAFILNPTQKGANFKIRWFSPTTEVPLCGHSTIASVYVLLKENILQLVEGFITKFEVEFNNGTLPISVSPLPHNDFEIWFTVPIPEFFPYGGQMQDVFRSLSMTDNDLDSRLPIYMSDSGYLFIPVLGLLTLRKLTPNFDALKEIMREESIRGVCTFSRESFKNTCTFHSRFFSPIWGINEDSITGTANAQLGVYWLQNLVREIDKPEYQFIGEQGFSLDKDGEVKIRIKLNGQDINTLEIGGTARAFISGYLHI